MDMLEELEKLGCDMEGAMERFLNDEDFYRECFEKVLEDPGFNSLGEALREKDVQRAFESAHALKGVLANLGLTSLYNIIVEIVNPLREEKTDGLLFSYERLLQERECYIAIMKKK